MQKAIMFLDDIVKNISCSAPLPARLSRNAKLRLITQIQSMASEYDYHDDDGESYNRLWRHMSTNPLSCEKLVSLYLVCPQLAHDSTATKTTHGVFRLMTWTSKKTASPGLTPGCRSGPPLTHGTCLACLARTVDVSTRRPFNSALFHVQTPAAGISSFSSSRDVSEWIDSTLSVSRFSAWDAAVHGEMLRCGSLTTSVLHDTHTHRNYSVGSGQNPIVKDYFCPCSSAIPQMTLEMLRGNLRLLDSIIQSTPQLLHSPQQKITLFAKQWHIFAANHSHTRKLLSAVQQLQQASS